jgi:hypothetical protein
MHTTLLASLVVFTGLATLGGHAFAEEATDGIIAISEEGGSDGGSGDGCGQDAENQTGVTQGGVYQGDDPDGGTDRHDGGVAASDDGQDQGMTATVNADVDLYDAPGGIGTVIGVLVVDSTVGFLGCQDDNWCEVESGWVWGDFLDH